MRKATAAKRDELLTMKALSMRWGMILLGCALLAGLASGPVYAQTGSENNSKTEANSGAATAPTNIVEIAKALNIWLIPFGITTLIAVWFTAERLVVLRRSRVLPAAFINRFLQQLEEGTLDKEGALAVCEQNGSPMALVFANGVRKWGKPSVEVEQAIIDGGERQVGNLRNHLRVLNGIATIAPLIGLLGTVVGMLQSFSGIAQAGQMGNVSQLSAGIATALLTTAAGLFVAIPVLTVYMYFAGRVDALVMEMDDLAQSLVQLISAEALADRASRPRSVVGTTGGEGMKGDASRLKKRLVQGAG